MARGGSDGVVFREHRAPVTAVALRPGGGAMISGDAEGVLVWYVVGEGPAGSRPTVVNDSLKCPAGEPLGVGPRFTAGVAGLAWAPASGRASTSPSGPVAAQRAAERVVVALATGRVVIANGAGDLLAAVAAGEVLHAAAFAGGSRWAVTSGSHGAIRVWDVAAAELESSQRRSGSADSGDASAAPAPAGAAADTAAAAAAMLPLLAAGAFEVRRDTAFPPGAKPAGVSMESIERGWTSPGGSSRDGGGRGPRMSMRRGRATATSEDGEGLSGRRRSGGRRGAAGGDAGDDDDDDSEDLDAVLDDILEGDESDEGGDKDDGPPAMSARRAIGSLQYPVQPVALAPAVLERAPWMLKGLGADQHGVVTALAVLKDGSSVVCGTRCGVVAAWTASAPQ